MVTTVDAVKLTDGFEDVETLSMWQVKPIDHSLYQVSVTFRHFDVCIAY